MSLLGTLLLAWAAVHTFAAVSYGFLSARRMRGNEYGSFALLSSGLAVYCVGAALLTDAGSHHEAAHAQVVLFVGIEIALASFVRFAFQLLDEPDSPCVRIAAWWAAGSILLDVAGFFFDPGRPGDPSHTLGAITPHPFEVAIQPPGIVAAVGGILIGSYTCLRLLRRASDNADIRLLLFGSLITLVAFVYDTSLRVMQVSSFYMVEHASILGSVMMSYLLLRRYIAAGDELSERTMELHTSYAELGKVQEQLVRREELAAIGELSAVIAHEVRNPLAILKNAVDGLRRPTLDEEDRQTLFGVLDEEADRLNRIVRDLLAYSSPVEPQAANISVEPLVDHAINLVRRASPRSGGVEIDVDLDGAPGSLRGDRNLLEQAIINIVENAMHAMPGGGRLTVRHRESRLDEQKALCLSFADTGVGMASDVRSRAREAFFTTRTTGTGLGLAIVERVVGAHGGRIELGGNPDGGTTVTLMLPLS